MSRRFTGLLLLAGLLILAVLLHRSTASYPAFVQGSTASYVRFLAWSLGILCVADLLLSFLRRRREAEAADSATSSAGNSARRFWALLMLLIVYSWALGPFGFFPASVVFLPVAMVAMGARHPLSIAGTSVGILIFIYLVFVKLLEVQLPEGTLF